MAKRIFKLLIVFAFALLISIMTISPTNDPIVKAKAIEDPTAPSPIMTTLRFSIHPSPLRENIITCILFEK